MKSNQALSHTCSTDQLRRALRRSSSLRLLLGSLGLAAACLTTFTQAGEVDAEPAARPGASRSSREQVRADRADAQRAGDRIINSETGQTAREANPKRYPPVVKPTGKTRQQVRSETATAIRTGDMTDAESGKKLNELNPKRYEKARQAEPKAAAAAAAPASANR